MNDLQTTPEVAQEPVPVMPAEYTEVAPNADTAPQTEIPAEWLPKLSGDGLCPSNDY